MGDDGGEHPVIAELRRRGPTTARDLAAALDVPLPELRARLRTLLSEGAITRTGHARSIRYQC